MITAPSLSALQGLRHAFFTREGGVSTGLYESLNGGVGSKDRAADVAENRARMARALRVDPAQFVTAYQIHSPDVVVAEEPWTAEARPKADNRGGGGYGGGGRSGGRGGYGGGGGGYGGGGGNRW